MRKMTLASAVFGCAMALAACGGKSKGGTTTPEPTPVKPADPTTPTEKPATGGGDAKLDATKCGELMDHVIELMSQNDQTKGQVDQLRQNRDQYVEECQKEATQKDYDCFMAAKSLEDAGKCGGEGGHDEDGDEGK
jgi:hypothetical protein